MTPNKHRWIASGIVTALLLWGLPAAAAASTPWGGSVYIDYDHGTTTVSEGYNTDCGPLTQTTSGYEIDCEPASQNAAGQVPTCHAPGVSAWLPFSPGDGNNTDGNGTDDNETGGNRTASGSQVGGSSVGPNELRASATCGDATAECTVEDPLRRGCHDAEKDVDQAPPLVCEVELGSPSQLDEWHVTCWATDPPLIPVI